jgi:ribosomal protein S18 acetylase RimI-like enzyme
MNVSSSDLRIDETTIRPLAADEAPMVGDVIADSHGDYPAFTHLFPDPAQRRRVLRRLMTGAARDASAFGAVTVAVQGERMLGTAVWLPPGAFPWTSWRKLKASTNFLPLLWQTRGATSEFFALGANAEKAAPAEPHWNLQVLGIRREAQGQGLGSQLLQPVLSRADRDGVPCYLETADPANLPFYQRFGFEFDRRHQLITDGPTHYSMRRPPQNRSNPEGGSR